MFTKSYPERNTTALQLVMHSLPLLGLVTLWDYEAYKIT